MQLPSSPEEAAPLQLAAASPRDEGRWGEEVSRLLPTAAAEAEPAAVSVAADELPAEATEAEPAVA